MNIRVAILAALCCGAASACATPADEPGAKAAAAEPRQSGSYRTGSRLPQYDSDGSASTGAASKDDYEDARRNTANPTRF